ncbi:hypothetical protein B0H19DRAFT_1134231 [Mycena capillaripes]|nr:hypothetical protein B0H19DRAFT_1134231 [Mycena capillaripes]
MMRFPKEKLKILAALLHCLFPWQLDQILLRVPSESSALPRFSIASRNFGRFQSISSLILIYPAPFGSMSSLPNFKENSVPCFIGY